MAHRSDEDPLDVDRYLYGDNSANRQGSPQKDKSMGQKLQDELDNLVKEISNCSLPGSTYGSHRSSPVDKTSATSSSEASNSGSGHMKVDDLLTRLAQQQSVIDQQQEKIRNKERDLNMLKAAINQQGDIVTQLNNTFITPPHNAANGIDNQFPSFLDLQGQFSAQEGMIFTPTGSGMVTPALSSLPVSEVQVSKLQQELQAAQQRIQAMAGELEQQRSIKHTFEQALASSPTAEETKEISEATIANLQTVLNNTRPNTLWRSAFDDARNDGTESLPDVNATSGAYPRPDMIWGNPVKSINTLAPPQLQLTLPQPLGQNSAFPPPLNRSHSVDGNDFYNPAGGPGRPIWNNRRTTFNNANPTGQNTVPTPELRFAGRRSPFNVNTSPFRSFEPSGTSISTGGYTPSPIGTPLSPLATDFAITSPTSSAWNGAGSPSSMQPSTQTYVSTSEPLNYRRLLERSVNCNWKYIVDKIVCNNDQQASIFLQQKLKIGTPEQRHAIVDAIVAQAYPLMVNRFGNFLVQRCFEHGTREQIEGIANAIRGNTLTLSMDAFGCHVIQKAFDCVDEDFKRVMVNELLRRIPETVVHRYACHVWQKLFELRWNRDPPQIMKYVNEALHGMWHEVALGETGSLVVQNIFENCLEDDKRPCVNEVLLNIDLIAHGQFGNWCIQHICEHGAPLDRSRALDTVIKNAPEYSMDQYASKVVEKCLKVGGPEFLDRYLDRVCEGRPDRPRIPLIDIASDQYGNYLVQWILQHASPTHREQVASHIRKHMVSLRGSKFGSRVGMLCCNPSYGRSTPQHGNIGNTTRFNNRWGFR